MITVKVLFWLCCFLCFFSFLVTLDRVTVDFKELMSLCENTVSVHLSSKILSCKPYSDPKIVGYSGKIKMFLF